MKTQRLFVTTQIDTKDGRFRIERQPGEVGTCGDFWRVLYLPVVDATGEPKQIAESYSLSEMKDMVRNHYDKFGRFCGIK